MTSKQRNDAIGVGSLLFCALRNPFLRFDSAGAPFRPRPFFLHCKANESCRLPMTRRVPGYGTYCGRSALYRLAVGLRALVAMTAFEACLYTCG